MAKKDGLIQRAGIKASNTVGKRAREDVSDILAAVAGSKRSTVKPRSKAASKFQAEPAYKLDFPKAIPIAALKSKKVDKKAGTVSFASLAGAVRTFAAKRGRGRGGRFVLSARNPLPARIIGGLVFTRSHRNPEVTRYANRLPPRLAEAFESEFEMALSRINRR